LICFNPEISKFQAFAFSKMVCNRIAQEGDSTKREKFQAVPGSTKPVRSSDRTQAK
jgi:hypothetical protein